MASHQVTMLGGHRHCSSGDMMILDCLTISQGDVINVPCDFMGRSPSRLVTILKSLVTIGHSDSGDIVVLIWP